MIQSGPNMRQIEQLKLCAFKHRNIFLLENKKDFMLTYLKINICLAQLTGQCNRILI